MDALRMDEVKYSISDVFALPEGQRAELIDGDLYMMAPPRFRHQRISSIIFARIFNYIENKGGKCVAVPAPFGVFLEEDDKNYVEPDISVICDPDKIGEDGCHGAPDWIIEIVSPASRRMDCFIKLNSYRKAGVREYWIVDPETRKVRVYDFKTSEEKDYTFEDTISAGIYEDLQIDMRRIDQKNS